MDRKFFATAMLTVAMAGAAASVAPAADPAKPSTQPAVVLPEVKVPDNLTGAQLAIKAQQAFNRGEYATALPMLRKMAAEAEGLPAKLSSIQDRILVCEKALAAAKAEAEAKLKGGGNPQDLLNQRPVDVSPEARKPHKMPTDGGVYDTSIQDLGNFEYDQEKGGNVPDDVTKLSGSSIRLRGYMIPMDQADNITQFALVPSLFACCFGQPPTIQHTIVASTPKGKAVSYTADEIQVEGKLKVQEKKDDGYLISLFELEVTSVKVAPPQK